MVKIKPARRRSIQPTPRNRTPVRKISRPSRSLHSVQKKSSASSPLQQKLQQFVWLLIGIIILFGIAFFILYRSILSYALEDTSTTTMVLTPEKIDANSQQVVFAYISAEQNDSFIALVPGDATVMLPGGYGQYRISAVYPLLNLEKKDTQFMIGSFSRGLGRAVDQVYGTAPVLKKNTLDTGALFGLIVQKTLVEKKLPVSLIRLWYFAKQGISVVPLTNLSELPKLVSQKKTADIPESQECPIGVLNATTQSGTASLLSNLFEQSGLITIRTSSYPETERVTTIYTAGNKKCDDVLAVVKKAFVIQPKIEESAAMTTQFRAPIVVLIGEDFQ